MTSSPATTSQIVGESPNHEGAPALGESHPQTPDRSTPKTNSPSPSAERTAPTTSIFGRASGGAS